MRNSARLLSDDAAVTSQWPHLMRSWLRVLIVAGFAGAAIFAALALAPARYAATVELQLQTPVPADKVAATIAALKSRDLARQVVTALDLHHLPALNGAPAMHDVFGWLDRVSGRHAQRQPGARNEQVLAAFARSLRVTAGHEEGSISVTVTARSADLASRIASHLVDLHVASSAATGTVQRAPASVTAGDEKKRLSEDLAMIEAEIARLKSRAGSAVDDQRRNDLAEALAQAEHESGAVSSRAAAARALLGKGKVETIAELQTSPTLHQLIAERVRVEVQKTGAERTLPADHPRIRDLRARLSELRWQMFREATAITEALEAEVNRAAAREADVRARLAGTVARAAAISDLTTDSDRIAALEDDAAAKRATLASLAARAPAAEGVAPAVNSNPTLAGRISRAQAISIPAFPRKGQFALLTTVTILMIGFAVVIIRALLVGNRRSAAEMGFADMAASARDRADIRLATLTFDSESPDNPGAAPPSTTDVRAQKGNTPATATLHVDAREPGQFVILSTTADTARHLGGRAMGRKGHRSLLVADRAGGATEARDLVSSLATAGRRCVLVDWARDGKGVALKLGAAARPGMNDLLDGSASFDDVIARLPDSDVHFISAGTASADPARPLDSDWINIVLDALDEAYDHIVVVAQLDEARNLFETIEGRFDAGIVMSDRRGQGPTINAGPGAFLGFEVTEIYIVQMDLAQQRHGVARRLKRGHRQAAA